MVTATRYYLGGGYLTQLLSCGINFKSAELRVLAGSAELGLGNLHEWWKYTVSGDNYYNHEDFIRLSLGGDLKSYEDYLVCPVCKVLPAGGSRDYSHTVSKPFTYVEFKLSQL